MKIELTQEELKIMFKWYYISDIAMKGDDKDLVLYNKLYKYFEMTKEIN